MLEENIIIQNYFETVKKDDLMIGWGWEALDDIYI